MTVFTDDRGRAGPIHRVGLARAVALRKRSFFLLEIHRVAIDSMAVQLFYRRLLTAFRQ